MQRPGVCKWFGISINHLENKKYIGKFKNGKRDGFGIYYDDVIEGNPSTHDVEECDDLNDNFKCDNEEGQKGFSNGIDGNGSLRAPALKPKFVGLWYEDKFVPYNEEVVQKEFADKNKSVEDHASLWHSAFYTKKAWEIHYQANQVVESGYKAALEAIATSRFVRYRIGKLALDSVARAKNYTRAAYEAKRKAIRTRSETLRLVDDALLVVNSSLKMEKLVGLKSKYLKKKQKRYEKAMKRAEENAGSPVEFKLGERAGPPRPPKKNSRRFNFARINGRMWVDEDNGLIASMLGTVFLFVYKMPYTSFIIYYPIVNICNISNVVWCTTNEFGVFHLYARGIHQVFLWPCW